MKKRIFSRVLALFMALTLLSTTAFAASFTDLQDAIEGNGGQNIVGSNRLGYAWNDDTQLFGIEAWNSDDGTRNVQLKEDVERVKGESGITLNGSKDSIPDKVVIDLNGKTIDANPNAVKVVNTDLKWHATPEVKFYEAQKDETGNKIANLDKEVKASSLNSGAIFSITNGADLTVIDSSAKTETGTDRQEHYIAGTGTGSITGGYNGRGGGIYISDGSFTMKGGAITDNYASEHGGGITSWGNAQVNLEGVSMTKNAAWAGGGAIFTRAGTNTVINDSQVSENVSWSGTIGFTNADTLTITNSIIKSNHATGASVWYSGGVLGNSVGVLEIDEETGSISSDNVTITNSDICNNTIGSESDGDRKSINIVLRQDGQPNTSITTHYWGEWEPTKEATPDENGVETRTCPHCGAEETREVEYVPDDSGNDTDNGNTTGGSTGDTTIPDGDTPLGDLPTSGDADADTTTIEDDEPPLAGIVTLADLLNALWEYEDIEEVELPENFQWLDHDYAQAIYWGLDEALVVDTEDNPLDPDELLTVGLMREVLENYVELCKGLEDFEVVLEGADEDLVMDLSERLTIFYGELEAALEALAA